MTLDIVKEKLHGYIENADQNKIVAMYTLIESDINEGRVMYNEETLRKLEERSENAFSGKSKTYTVEESMENIRKHRKNNGI